MKVERLGAGPIITPQTDASIGPNINGPSLIRVPAWVHGPLGRYYLYFAAHRGMFIRLAYSDAIAGPWRVYSPGTLRLPESMFVDHIASPDVHVDQDAQEILMYYHGQCEDGTQATRLAVSRDGLHFRPMPERLGPWYFRVFGWNGLRYALTMPGTLYWSRTGRAPFERGPSILPPDTRHTAVWLDGVVLYIVFSRVGDCPERLLLSAVRLEPDWRRWRASSPPQILLEPDTAAEGRDLLLRPSERGEAVERLRELRDPAVFEDDGGRYLLYSVAGESGIAIARLAPDDPLMPASPGGVA